MGSELTPGQRWLLEHLQYGEKIAYSQDGDNAWLWPSNVWIGSNDISDDELADLRAKRFIGTAPFDEDELYRHTPGEIITEAGRAALANGDVG